MMNDSVPFAPSDHRSASLPARLAYYRRIIGTLRLKDHPGTLTERQSWDLHGMIHEAMSVTGSPIKDAAEQLHLMQILLSETLNEKRTTLAVEKSTHEYLWNR
ncbi:MAG: hypothetical protein ACRD4G_13630 [Bryobacteraceae bacterium]